MLISLLKTPFLMIQNILAQLTSQDECDRLEHSVPELNQLLLPTEDINLTLRVFFYLIFEDSESILRATDKVIFTFTDCV